MLSVMSERGRTPDWSDPDAWEVVRAVDVFDEHTKQRRGEDGKESTSKVTKRDLEQIARNNNERDRTGQPCPLTVGHTRDDAPEEQQPEIVGYARNFRVVYREDLKRYVLRADHYLRKEKATKAREYPRVSVEYWPDSKFLDPIALLRRTPQRDLGQWTYHRRPGKGAVLRYAMGDKSMPDFPDDRDQGRRPDPTEPPDANRDPDEADEDKEFHGKVMKCMRAGYPHLDRIHKEYAEKYSGEPGAEDGSLPGEDDKDRDRDVPEQNRRNRELRAPGRNPEDVIQYRKLLKEVSDLRAERERDKADVRESRRREAVGKAIDEFGLLTTVEEVMQFARGRNDDEFAKFLDHQIRTCKRDPAAGPMVRVRGESPVEATPRTGGRDPDEFTREDLERAEQFMRQKPGLEWEEYEQMAREARPRRYPVSK